MPVDLPRAAGPRAAGKQVDTATPTPKGFSHGHHHLRRAEDRQHPRPCDDRLTVESGLNFRFRCNNCGNVGAIDVIEFFGEQDWLDEQGERIVYTASYLPVVFAFCITCEVDLHFVLRCDMLEEMTGKETGRTPPSEQPALVALEGGGLRSGKSQAKLKLHAASDPDDPPPQ